MPFTHFDSRGLGPFFSIFFFSNFPFLMLPLYHRSGFPEAQPALCNEI